MNFGRVGREEASLNGVKIGPLTREITREVRYFDFEVPELPEVSKVALLQVQNTTYYPSGTLAISELLCVRPLEQEVVCRIKLRW